jgi:hypothetical protein
MSDDHAGGTVTRTRPTTPIALLLVCLCLWLGPLTVGCGSEPTPQEPEGGYLAFRDALLSGSSANLWDWITEDTKQLYQDAIADLQALTESVQLLSPADRAVAYERTAVRLAERAQTGRQLFVEIVRIADLFGDERYRVGTDPDDVVLHAGDPRRATVTTRAGQSFELVREDDGVWRVSSLATMARSQLQAIAENLSAVDVLAAESAYMRRSHAEIVRLLGGRREPPPGDGEGGGEAP